MTPAEFKRRTAPIMGVLNDYLDFIEEEGVAYVLDQDKAVCALGGLVLSFLDTIDELPAEVLRRG